MSLSTAKGMPEFFIIDYISRGPWWPSRLASLASNHRLSPLCGFNSHKWQMLWTCSDITLAIEQDAKPQLLNFEEHISLICAFKL